MADSNFLETFLEKVDNIRENEFSQNNFVYTEPVLEKKILNENLMEFKKFKTTIKKKASIEKLKPGNITKKEYDTVNDDIDILEDDIFNNENTNLEDEIKIDFMGLTREKKIELIFEYISRKNIYLNEEQRIEIETIVDNPDVLLKKYINISKMYHQITKIGFIKKLENGSYVIDLNDTKAKKVKKYFMDKK
jgi:hypothetical protein